MTSAISLQARILRVNHVYQSYFESGFDDNFDIRLSQRLAEFECLDLPTIKKTVKGIKTNFFRVHKVNRERYAQHLFDDLKACELLGEPIKERGKIIDEKS